MNHQPKRVADAKGVDLGLVSSACDERIVLRHAAVVVQAKHLPTVFAGVLRPRGLAQMIGKSGRTDRQVDLAVAAEHETSGGRSVGPRSRRRTRSGIAQRQAAVVGGTK